MEPINSYPKYLNYKTLLNYVNTLIEYYKHREYNIHNHVYELQKAKRELLKTKYKTLIGPNGKKISIDKATDQQINRVFKKAFSETHIAIREYLKTKTKPWYETRIKNYENKLRRINPQDIKPEPESLEKAIIAEEILRKHPEKEADKEKADKLRETIEQKLEKCSKDKLGKILDAYKPNIVILLQYSAFKNLIFK